MLHPCGGLGKGAKSDVIGVLPRSQQCEVSEVMIGDADDGFVTDECAGSL